MNCSECGKVIGHKVYPNQTCQGCYLYFLRGGTVSDLPSVGEITQDYRGFVTCHICGRSYKRLGSHVRMSHGLTTKEYKEQFGLCACARTTEGAYSAHMRERAYVHEMPKQLLVCGVETRIKRGDSSLRAGKIARAQECLDKRKRKRLRNDGN